MKKSKQTKRERPTYADQFKENCVLLDTTSSRPIPEVAMEPSESFLEYLIIALRL
jgi:hypothetical protein